ncbi:MAG: hypothetical protein GF398_02090 [Chitinivibrionales bacterium]|nr:hypothetical protein [Chitinivibrionales bacterium]
MQRFVSGTILTILAATTLLTAQSIEQRLEVLESKVNRLEARLDRLEGDKQPAPQASQGSPWDAPAPPKPQAAADATTYEASPIKVEIVDKGLREVTLPSGKIDKQISFLLLFENTLAQTVKSLRGDLHFMDNSRRKIIQMELNINQEIPPGKKASWKGGIGVNPEREANKLLLSIDKSKLHGHFAVKQVTYADGTIEHFAPKQ